MKLQLSTLWEVLRGSFWFIPTLMAVGAIGLSVLMPWIDEIITVETDGGLPWLATTVAASRAVLTAIATSMITVSGVVFSLNMVALSLTTQQFGSRLVRTLMDDRVTQVALGTFLSCSLYSLLLLRDVYTRPDYQIPHLSVLMAVFLTVLSLGMLIFFMHHVAIAIQAQNVIRSVAGDLSKSIERLFPERLGQPADDAVSEPLRDQLDVLGRPFVTVVAAEYGYLHAIDLSSLMHMAVRHGLVCELMYRPGDFVVQGLPLVKLWPARPVEAALSRKINDAFSLDARRTPLQDVEAAVIELVELMVRSLSPAINAPLVATAGIDYLAAALVHLLERRIPSAYREDEHGRLRIVARPYTFPEVLNTGLDQVRQYGRTSVAVTIRLLRALEVLALKAGRSGDLAAIRRQAEMIERGCHDAVPEAEDRQDIRRHFDRVLQALEAKREMGIRD